MSAESVALAHLRDRRRLATALAADARRAWAQVDPADIARSWLAQVPALSVDAAGAQFAAAQTAETYVTAALTAQGIAPDAVGRLVPASLSGVASDGRPLVTLLYQPVVASLLAIRDGVSLRRALAAGLATLDTVARTQVYDAGRVADQLATVAQNHATGYVRMVVGKTCPRCLILAGKRYRWNQGFRRHPRCDCVHIPTREDTAGSLTTDPRAAFRAMTHAEQDAAFGKAGAEAIRHGADMSQVVNANSGAYVAGGRRFTTTGTGRHGLAGIRLSGAPRLMPEQIYREANGNREEALRLLRLHGYII